MRASSKATSVLEKKKGITYASFEHATQDVMSQGVLPVVKVSKSTLYGMNGGLYNLPTGRHCAYMLTGLFHVTV